MARGHIRQRSEGSWTLIVELERDAATGKRRQKWETFRGRKRDAEDRLAALLTEAQKGMVGNAGSITLGEYVDRWLRDYAGPNTAPKTHQGYTTYLKKHVEPTIGRVQLEKLRSTHILALHAQLRKTPSGRDEEALLSAMTIRHVHRALFTALEHAVKWKLIPVNPAAAVDAPTATAPEMKTLDAAQAAAVLAEAQTSGLRWHAYFTVALTTGLRLSELAGLRWQDVDLAAETLIVRQTIQNVPGIGLVTKPPKTAKSRRTVDLGADVVAVLRRWKAEQNGWRLQLGEAWGAGDLVFTGHLGGRIDDKTVRAALVRLCERAKAPTIRVHDLRHTAATLMLLAGVNVKVVSERLGHANIAITLQTYSHVLPTMQKGAAKAMDALLRAQPRRSTAI